jgi:hypothetical protein
MNKKFFLLGGLLALLGALAGPLTVDAEGGSLASPTPLRQERITAPEISGIYPDVSLSEGIQGDTHPSDFFSSPGIHVPLPISMPAFVEPESTSIKDSPEIEFSLAVPLRNQGVDTITCGPAALGMAMDFHNLKTGGRSPSTQELTAFLEDRGLMYEWGTGVEELVYAARAFGFPGSTTFQGWSLEMLEDELKQGVPVVVPLGENGPGQTDHFVVLTGISSDGKWVAYNDPLSGEILIPLDKFLEKWKIQGLVGLILKKEPLTPVDDPNLP